MSEAVRDPAASDPLSSRLRRLFRELPGSGTLPEGAFGPGIDVYRGQAGREADGARVVFHLGVEKSGRRVTEVRFQAYGCPHTLATAAWLAEQLPGRLLENLLPSAPADWLAELGIPVEKFGRLLLVEDALRAISTVL